MSIEDKRKLLDALNTEGFNIIYDLDKLRRDYLPDKEENEIQQMVNMYTRKGKEALSKLREERCQSRGSKIEEWYTVVHESIDFASKRDDLSKLFINIFQKRLQTFHNASQSDDEGPNFFAVYQYLIEIMKGKYPPDLQDSDALVILSLIEHLKTCVESSILAEERKFLQEAKWWQQNESSNMNLTLSEKRGTYNHNNDNGGEASNEPAVTTSTVNLSTASASEAIISVDRSSGISQPQPDITDNETLHQTSESGSPNPVACLSHADMLLAYTEECVNMPKIRKIKHCLNPLDVPVYLLNKEHAALEGLLKKFVENAEDESPG
ncbi:hypothetical protein HDE_14195 [Halotydeus destructor]|nr:hypothetical protein HDE_14195 [Halotydeus destructor]